MLISDKRQLLCLPLERKTQVVSLHFVYRKKSHHSERKLCRKGSKRKAIFAMNSS